MVKVTYFSVTLMIIFFFFFDEASLMLCIIFMRSVDFWVSEMQV